MLKFTTKQHKIDVEIDGAKYILRELTGTERDRYETSLVKFVGDKPVINRDNVKAKLVHIALCKKDGTPAFDKVEDVGALPARVLNTLYDEAERLSGMSNDALEEAGED